MSKKQLEKMFIKGVYGGIKIANQMLKEQGHKIKLTLPPQKEITKKITKE